MTSGIGSRLISKPDSTDCRYGFGEVEFTYSRRFLLPLALMTIRDIFQWLFLLVVISLRERLFGKLLFLGDGV